MGHIEVYKQTEITLQSATGNKIEVAGVIELKIKIGKINGIHSFCITEDLNENIILGRDFFKQNKITLNYNNETMILNGHNIPLDDDDYLASLIRMNSDQILPPQ